MCLHGELHLYGPTSGVFFNLDIDATGTVQRCYRYPVFGSYSVDLFSFVLERATWNGTLVIDGVTTDEWACPTCPANNKLWVSKDALPVRDSNLSGESAFTRDYKNVKLGAPPDTEFVVSPACPPSADSTVAKHVFPQD